MTSRSAWKDLDNNLVFNEVLPVRLTDLIGGTLEEQESILADQTRTIVDPDGNTYETRVFMEMLEATGAEVLYSWKGCAFGDYAAVLRNTYGEGTAYYLGTSLKEEALSHVFDRVMKDCGLEGIPNTSVETIVRKGKEGTYKIRLDFEHFTWNIEREERS